MHKETPFHSSFPRNEAEGKRFPDVMPVTEANLGAKVATFLNTSCSLLAQTPSTTAPSPTRESWHSCHYRASHHHHPCHPSLRSPGSQILGGVNAWILTPRVPRLHPRQQPKQNTHRTVSMDRDTVARLWFVL